MWSTPEQTAVISGNPAGLTSLARHLLTLAQNGVPDGNHFDFDTYSGWLAEDSIALRIEVER
ncbi:Imm32 family immunity protein [Planobispora siamensis]